MGEVMNKCRNCSQFIPLGGICLDCETEVCSACDGYSTIKVNGEDESCSCCDGTGTVDKRKSERSEPDE